MGPHGLVVSANRGHAGIRRLKQVRVNRGLPVAGKVPAAEIVALGERHVACCAVLAGLGRVVEAPRPMPAYTA